MIDNFFKKLAKRLYKENDLSDITWAIAKTNSHFMELFMKLFDFKRFRCDKPWNIDRENPSDSQGSRPDFIVSQEEEYVIENKINDMNYHFSQYAKDFPNSKRGFISAYKLDDKAEMEADNYKFQIAHWQDFIDLLQESLDKKIFKGEDSLLINAYIIYVKEVCSIMTFKEVRGIEELSGLYNFNILVEWVIDNFKKEDYKCKLYEANAARKYGDTWSGKYAELKYKDKKELYPVFGIEYTTDNTNICITTVPTLEYEDIITQ